MSATSQMPPPVYCSFCGKSDREAEGIIHGPCVFICFGCVDLVTAMVADRRAGATNWPEMYETVEHDGARSAGIEVVEVTNG